MANVPTTTTSLGDSVAAEIVNDDFVSTAYAAATIDRLIHHDFVEGSLVKSHPRLAKITAAALTEGTDGEYGEVTDTQVSITIAEIGKGVALTDLSRVGSSVKDLSSKIQLLLARAYADKIDTDVLALASSLTDSVSNTGGLATEDMWFQAVFEILTNDAYGLKAGFFFPKQIQQILQAIGGTTENQSAVWGRADFLEGLDPTMMNGYVTKIGNIPVFGNSNVPTANAAVDSRGMIFIVGPDGPFCRNVGMLDGSPWDGRLEFQRDASLRATEAWATGATGSGVVAPERGCSFVSIR